MTRAYYNEFNQYAAAWLRNLIDAGLIPHGDVDTRSIDDISASELDGYTQCHFFAGIGGWAYAARLAGWPDNRPLWTGSCPCQPFSVAGKGLGFEDPRDKWPIWRELIRARRPAVVVGEQVARTAGAVWLARTRADLEGIGYAARACVVPACAVEAPHERERLWFVADANGGGAQCDGKPGNVARAASEAEGQGRQRERGGSAAGNSSERSFWTGAHWLDCADGKQRRLEPGIALLADGLPRDVAGALAGFGNAIVPQVGAEILGAYLDAYGGPRHVR